MTQIEGKFYPLQKEEWVQVCKELSSGARDVLYYIRTSDPYGNGVDLTAAAIALELGVNRSTVSRALKELDAKGYIELEIIKARATISGKGLLVTDTVDDAEMQPRCKNATDSAEMQQPVQNCNTECENATTSAEMQQTEAETLTQQGTQTPKTSKIPKTFKTPLERRQEVLSVWEEFKDRLKIYGVYAQMWVGEDLIDRDDYQECVKASYKHSPEELRRRLIAFCMRVKDMKANEIGDIYRYLKSYLTTS